MKNILSYPLGTLFTGKEIKEWITYHTNNKTSKSRIAKKMIDYLTIDDNYLYCLTHGDTCSSRAKDFLVMRYKPF